MKELVNFHGSDIEKVASYYELEESFIHNYSGNVNPLGLSPALEKKLIDNIHLVTSYPDPDYKKLKESIADYANTSAQFVLLGNGTTELIAHYIDYVNPKKALIVGPTYSEYEKKIKTCSASIVYYPLEIENDFVINARKLMDLCQEDIDLLVLCNPNNPTATLTSSKDLFNLFDLCKSLGIHILIDETYMDFVENANEVSAISLITSYTNCIVLRGFSKFFSAPGLRLGYGVTSDMNCHRSMEKQRHHWSINSLAAFAGTELMKDQAFILSSKSYITKERNRIMDILSKEKDLKVFPTNANFFFIQLLNPKHNTKDIFDYLIRKGLMIRDASSFPFLHGEFIRFCILTEEENNQLLTAITHYLH